MNTFRLPQSGSCSRSSSGGGEGGIEIVLPTGASGGEPQLTEAAAVQQLHPESLGHALAELTADVPPESGSYCVALAQVSRHLDAWPSATVAALCPRQLEQAVRGTSARLRRNAMALFAELVPRSGETTRLFAAQFCSALQPAETDKHAMLAVALVVTSAMRRFKSGAGSTAPTRSAIVAPVPPPPPPPSRRPLIQEIGESPPALLPANPGAVAWEQVDAWIPLHELLVARLQDAVQPGLGSDSASGVAPTRLHTAMADAALEICRISCEAVGTPDGSAHMEQWLHVWARTRWVLRGIVGAWLTPADGKKLPSTSAGPCPALSDLLAAVTSAEHDRRSTRSAERSSWVVRQLMECLPWMLWECLALSSSRRLQAALAASSSPLSTALLLLRAPGTRREKALASPSVRRHLLLVLLDGSTFASEDAEVDRLLRATLLGALLGPCCLATTDATAMDDLVKRVEEWVVAAPTFDAASPALAVAVELIAYNTKLMVKHITGWLNVDEAAAIGSAAQELLGESASQALEASSCRMRRWAVQLIGRVASPESELRSSRAGSNEIFTKIASCLTVPLLRTVSTCSKESGEKAEVLQVLHRFPAAVVIPAILEQEFATPAQRCRELTQFVQAVASAHDAAAAAGADLSSDTFKELAAECVASIFDFARASSPDFIREQPPPNSPVQLKNPGQIGLASPLDSATAGKVRAEKSEILDLIATNLYRWLVILCGDSTQELVPGRTTARWVRAMQIALEKTFALASDQISLRLFGSALGGGEGIANTLELPADAYDAIVERCRIQMQGQPALSLELLEEDDKRQADATKPKVGAQYKVLLRATVRETVDTSSARLRALTVGDLVTVEAHALHEATGQIRVRLKETDGGWTSMVAQDGRQILGPVHDTAETTPSLIQSLLFERLRPLLVLRMMPAGIICNANFGRAAINDSVVGLLSERLTQPLEFDQVRKLGAEVLGQIVALPAVLVLSTAALESMITSSDGGIFGDHVLGAKAWVYSMCTAIGLWRSRSTLAGGQITAVGAESTVKCLLRVLQTGAAVPPAGNAELSEEEKLSRGCTDAIAALLCALCASEELESVGRSVLDYVVSQLSRPDAADTSSSWAARAIAAMQVLKTVGLMFGGNTTNETTGDDRALPKHSGVATVLMHAFGPIIDLANVGTARSSSSIEEISQIEASDDTEYEEQLLLLRPAALQLAFSIVLQLKSDVLTGKVRDQVFDVCEAACCAADESSRLRGAQLAGAIMYVPMIRQDHFIHSTAVFCNAADFC